MRRGATPNLACRWEARPHRFRLSSSAQGGTMGTGFDRERRVKDDEHEFRHDRGVDGRGARHRGDCAGRRPRGNRTPIRHRRTGPRGHVLLEGLQPTARDTRLGEIQEGHRRAIAAGARLRFGVRSGAHQHQQGRHRRAYRRPHQPRRERHLPVQGAFRAFQRWRSGDHRRRQGGQGRPPAYDAVQQGGLVERRHAWLV